MTRRSILGRELLYNIYTIVYLCKIHTCTTHFNILQHTATHCIILQRTATHCNTLQHSATYYTSYVSLGTIHAYVMNMLSLLRLHRKKLQNKFSRPPDPINRLCSFTGVCNPQKYFTCRSVQIFGIFFTRHIRNKLQNNFLVSAHCSHEMTVRFDLTTDLCECGLIKRT